MTPAAPLYPLTPESSPLPNSLYEFPFHSEETVRQFLFKIKLLKIAGEPPQLSCIPWSKTKLRAIVK